MYTAVNVQCQLPLSAPHKWAAASPQADSTDVNIPTGCDLADGVQIFCMAVMRQSLTCNRAKVIHQYRKAIDQPSCFPSVLNSKQSKDQDTGQAEQRAVSGRVVVTS